MISNSLLRLSLVIVLSASLGACSTFRFPGVHRITVQQGNVITQQMIDKLRPGMTKSQVKFVLGNAVIDHGLENERWDYVYTIQIAGGNTIRKVLALYFVEDRLSYFSGDFVPSEVHDAILDAA